MTNFYYCVVFSSWILLYFQQFFCLLYFLLRESEERWRSLFKKRAIVKLEIEFCVHCTFLLSVEIEWLLYLEQVKRHNGGKGSSSRSEQKNRNIKKNSTTDEGRRTVEWSFFYIFKGLSHNLKYNKNITITKKKW
jgi:hypothetical protein